MSLLALHFLGVMYEGGPIMNFRQGSIVKKSP